MKVLVKRDSSMNTVVDLGDGPDADAKLRSLCSTHGNDNVTNEDGTPVVLSEPVKAKAKSNPKAKSKRSR